MSETTIYFAEFADLLDEAAIAKRLPEVPAARRERIARVRTLDAKASLLASGLLLNASLQKAGVRDTTLTIGENGKPALAVEQGVYFNLSHSGTAVCCAISAVPCGVDIEKIDAPHDLMRIANRFFSTFECGAIQMSPEPNEAFCRLWTLRESYVKMRGTGFSLGLSALRCDFRRGICTMLENDVRQEDAFFLEFRHIYGYRGALCTLGETKYSVERLPL